MFKAFVPSITLPAGKSDIRKGGGIGIICNGRVMLFDGFEGGEPTNGMKAWLAENDVSTVDVAVLSHVHYDHYNGLLQIEDDSRFHIKQVLMYDPLTLKHGCDGSANGRAVKDDMNNAYKFIRAMQAHGTKVNWLDKGGVVKCGDTSWKVYRNQPRKFTSLDDGNAYAFVNDGSLVLYSPEVQLLFGGDGCIDLKDAIAYFKAAIIAMYVQHHGNDCPESSARAAAQAGVILMWETNVERNGAGTTGFTMYGSRRVVQAGIPVWMQNQPIYIEAANGKIVFKQGGKIVTASVPYQSYQTGWNKDAKGWFYILSDGRRAKGWIKVGWSKPQSKDGKDWFYMDKDGYMVRGLHKCSWSGGIDTFYFDENGVMQYGWKYINGKWYFFDKNGAMHTGWIFDDGAWYYLGTDGKMVTCWVTYKGKKCYLEPKSDRTHVQGQCYISRTATIDGKTYRFDKDGYAEEITASGGDNITNVSGKLNDISASRRQFVIDIANYVRKYAPQYGIKVYSPVIAQAIHESGWGESKLSAKYHNYFGLKCGTKWTGKSVNMKTQEEYSAGSLSTISANFRAYDSMEEGVKGYFDFIQLPRYANLKGVTSPRQYLQNIKDDGYATGSQYVDHVMNTLNLYNLTQFDAPVSQPAAKPTEDPVDVLIRIMEAEVGTHEGPNNHTKYGDEMHAIQPSNMDKNAPWCDAFFDWCILKLCEYFGYGADMARKVLCGDFDDYTYASVALYKKAGRWFDSPQRGDQIFFGGSGHTGGVVSVYGGTENTIEGNKGDEVRRCSYSIHSPSIIGYGRPRYYLLTGKQTAEDMPLIKKGSKGSAVLQLQKILNSKGYKLSEDSDFGPATEAAVKAFQKANHLENDGEVGPLTWAALLK